MDTIINFFVDEGDCIEDYFNLDSEIEFDDQCVDDYLIEKMFSDLKPIYKMTEKK